MTHPSDIAGLSERDVLDELRWPSEVSDVESTPAVTRLRMYAVAEIERRNAALDSLSARVRDYEEVLADKRRLAREIDVALHGEKGAAKQASLCDLVEPARQMRDRALRAEQQRDEAYERAAKVEASYQEILRACRARDMAAIRRLASGPESAAKPQESKP